MKETLFQTIKAIGDLEASKRWAVTPRAVSAWRHGERSPAVSLGLAIAKIEGWSLEQVYADLPRFKTPHHNPRAKLHDKQEVTQ